MQKEQNSWQYLTEKIFFLLVNCLTDMVVYHKKILITHLEGLSNFFLENSISIDLNLNDLYKNLIFHFQISFH